MKISIIIPNYNGRDLIKKNLPKVIEAARDYLKKDRHWIEIIMADDGSTDDSIEFINSLESEIDKSGLKLKIIRNDKNLGFSSTVNKAAKNSEGDILVLLNTDIYPEINFLGPLLNHFERDNIFAVGCLDKSLEKKNIILRGRGIGKWRRGFLVHSRGEIDKPSTLWASGGSSAFRKKIWDKLGGFNEIYSPFYWEDIDISYRALKSGYDVVFERESVVFHEHEKGSIKTKYNSFMVKTIAYRNQFIFVWGNLTDWDLKILHLLWLPYHFAKALLRKDWAFFRGFLRAFLILPQIVQSSSRAKKLFIKKDKDVIASLTR